MNIFECKNTQKIGKVKLKNGIIQNIHADNFTEEEAVLYGIRQEHISISSSTVNGLLGKVGVVEHLESETFIYADIDNLGTITVKIPGTYICDIGDSINLSFDPNHGHIFDKHNQAISSRIN